MLAPSGEERVRTGRENSCKETRDLEWDGDRPICVTSTPSHSFDPKTGDYTISAMGAVLEMTKKTPKVLREPTDEETDDVVSYVVWMLQRPQLVPDELPSKEESQDIEQNKTSRKKISRT